MKKLIFSLLFAVVGYATADACTNVMVTRGASKKGSTMISYTADSHQLFGALSYLPAANYPTGSMRKVRDWDSGRILGSIPEVEHTYSVVGNMNEHQLLIGESTWGGREGLTDPNAIIDYGSLIQIALQRSKTAREAVQTMGKLVADYGYYSSGESFSIADGKEVWYLELIGKGVKMVKDRKTGKMVNANKGAVWVALRVPDGMISAHANQARITTFPLNDPENCLYAADVIDFARAKGYFKGEDKDFDFSAAFNPVEASGARACEARVWSMFRRACTDGSMDKYESYALGHDLSERMPLWVKPTEKLDVKDVASLMRDHYQGTPMDMSIDAGAGPFKCPYRWRPMGFTVDSVDYLNERAISTQQTGWWYVGESRSWLPDVVGGVYWFGTDDTATSPLTPYYSSSTRIATSLQVGNGSMMHYSPTSMFWIQNRVSNFAYLRYNMVSADIRRVMNRWENARYVEQDQIDAQALILYSESPEKAVDFLTNYSVSTAQNLFQSWVDLDAYLLVKYIDGNVKKETAEGVFTDNGENFNIPTGPTQPGYSDSWKRMVSEDPHSEILKVRK